MSMGVEGKRQHPISGLRVNQIEKPEWGLKGGLLHVPAISIHACGECGMHRVQDSV